MDSAPSNRAIDLLIEARWVLPILPSEKDLLENHSVAIHNGKILAVLPHAAARARYIPREHLVRLDHVVMPGLINAHTHTGMTCMRGRADDKPLLEWLRETIWPIEGAFVSQPDFCYDGALLAAAEMTRGGTTAFSDMYWYPESGARAAMASGLRAVIGMIVIQFPSSYASHTDEYIDNGHRVMQKFSKEERLSFSYAPHAPYTVADDTWKKLQQLTNAGKLRMHTHLHETAAECTASVAQDRDDPACHLSETATRPMANLDRIGVLSSNLVAAHMVHLTDEEIELCARRGVNIAHCPTSNAKLASGFCQVHKLLRADVNVALGTDSACSNNSLDLFAEMKMCALKAKNLTNDATVLPAHTAIRMATINGARALGIDDVTGSLCPGKFADVICVELGTHAGNTPVFDVHSALVYAASRFDVTDVFVAGECLLRNKRLMKLNESDIVGKSKYWANEIVERFPLA